MEIASSPENFKEKNDGMHLIVETFYRIQQLQEYLKQSCLAAKCEFVESTDDVEEVSKR